jgi:hypothetical protein
MGCRDVMLANGNHKGIGNRRSDPEKNKSTLLCSQGIVFNVSIISIKKKGWLELQKEENHNVWRSIVCFRVDGGG